MGTGVLFFLSVLLWRVGGGGEPCMGELEYVGGREQRGVVTMMVVVVVVVGVERVRSRNDRRH